MSVPVERLSGQANFFAVRAKVPHRRLAASL
jgi:hypothetical protein